jgi:hypothetical protein
LGDFLSVHFDGFSHVLLAGFHPATEHINTCRNGLCTVREKHKEKKEVAIQVVLAEGRG